MKVLERQVNDFKQDAMQKNLAGDKNGAMKSMKLMKMRQAELVKLQGQELMMEQQKSMIDQGMWDANVVGALEGAQAAIKNQNLNADKIDDLRAELEEQQEAMNERQDMFASYANQDNDGLLDELDAMCADEIAG